MEALGELWTGAGLEAVETRTIAVQRTFADFGDFWSTSLLTANLGSIVAAMAPDDVERLKGRVQARLPLDAAGRIICGHTPTQSRVVNRNKICRLNSMSLTGYSRSPRAVFAQIAW
jgi:hypothetical protein